MRQNARERPLRKKVAFIVFLTVGGLFTWSLVKNLFDLMRLGGRLDEVKQEVVSLEEENYTLKQQALLVEDPDYVDKEVREKLGVVKPGETLVIIPDELMEQPDFEYGLDNRNDVAEDLDNWQKWLALFL